MALVQSWVRSLRSRNLSPHTLVAYGTAGKQLASFLASSGTTLVTCKRRDVEGFIDSLLSRNSAQTARNRFISIQQFYKWLVAEGEVGASPMVSMQPPVVPEKNRQVPKVEQVQALLKACEGPRFIDKRDLAIVSLLVDTGMRAAECLGLSLNDVDLDNRVCFVLGKGRKARMVPFGHEAAMSLDRYLRTRAQQRQSEGTDMLWLGQRGPLTDTGLQKVVDRRTEIAGLPHLHPHLFRHGFAHYWLVGGGSEGNLMNLLGWRSAQMVAYYARATAGERAIEAYRRGGSPLRGNR